ncbi:MAG: MOSC domain-containing protein [Gemmobacter sp.]
MTARLARIVRHPIKSAGFEELDAVRLAPGEAMPWDRHWAVAHAAARFGAAPDGWASKMNFLRGWAEPRLMAISAVLEPEARRLTLSHPDAGSITLWPDDEPERLIAWLRPLWPDTRPEPAAVVQVPGQAMSDVPDPYLAILGLASNRALGQRLGMDLSIHRWRGNLWLDGLAPWEEFDLVGREIAIGPVRLRVEERITRCRATGANPETGRLDADTLGALEAGYGHQDFGVYARVLTPGTLRIGDAVAP